MLSTRHRWLAIYLQSRRRHRLLSAAPPVPNAPTVLWYNDNVVAVELGWTDNSSDETGFRIYRNGVVLTETAADTPSYFDFDVIETHVYHYYVVAFNENGESAPSNEIIVVVGS